MSIWHNASSVVVRFRTHDKQENPIDHVLQPGDEVSIRDCYDKVVPKLAPQMKLGFAPEPAPMPARPPKDPKRQSTATQ